MKREKWLNGWTRNGNQVLIGSGLYCSCCGRLTGSTCFVFDRNHPLPDTLPDWQFEEADCPLCKDQYIERTELTVEEIAAQPISTILQSIKLKKKDLEGDNGIHKRRVDNIT